LKSLDSGDPRLLKISGWVIHGSTGRAPQRPQWKLPIQDVQLTLESVHGCKHRSAEYLTAPAAALHIQSLIHSEMPNSDASDAPRHDKGTP
jgi:hypothetical protein